MLLFCLLSVFLVAEIFGQTLSEQCDNLCGFPTYYGEWCDNCIGDRTLLYCDAYDDFGGFGGLGGQYGLAWDGYTSDCRHGCSNGRCNPAPEPPRPLPLNETSFNPVCEKMATNLHTYWYKPEDIGGDSVKETPVPAGDYEEGIRCPLEAEGGCTLWSFESAAATQPGLSFENGMRYIAVTGSSVFPRENLANWAHVRFNVRPASQFGWQKVEKRMWVTFMLSTRKDGDRSNPEEWFEYRPVEIERGKWTTVDFNWGRTEWRPARKVCAALDELGQLKDGQCRETCYGSGTAYNDTGIQAVCGAGNICCVGYETGFWTSAPRASEIDDWGIKFISGDRAGRADHVMMDDFFVCGDDPCENKCAEEYGEFCDRDSRQCQCLNDYPWVLGPYGECHNVDEDDIPCAECPTPEMYTYKDVGMLDGVSCEVETVYTDNWWYGGGPIFKKRNDPARRSRRPSFSPAEPGRLEALQSRYRNRHRPQQADEEQGDRKRQFWGLPSSYQTAQCECQKGFHNTAATSKDPVTCVATSCAGNLGGDCKGDGSQCVYNQTALATQCVCRPGFYDATGAVDGSGCQLAVCTPTCAHPTVCNEQLKQCVCLPGFLTDNSTQPVSCYRGCEQPCLGLNEFCRRSGTSSQCDCFDGFSRDAEQKCVPTCADKPCGAQEDCVVKLANLPEGTPAPGSSEPVINNDGTPPETECRCKVGLVRNKDGQCEEAVLGTTAPGDGQLETRPVDDNPCPDNCPDPREKCDSETGTCVCQARFTRSTVTNKCVDEACGDQCGAFETCVQRDGSAGQCECQPNYTRVSADEPCKPVDQCVPGTERCPCKDDGTCIGNALTCASDVCIDPSKLLNNNVNSGPSTGPAPGSSFQQYLPWILVGVGLLFLILVVCVVALCLVNRNKNRNRARSGSRRGRASTRRRSSTGRRSTLGGGGGRRSGYGSSAPAPSSNYATSTSNYGQTPSGGAFATQSELGMPRGSTTVASDGFDDQTYSAIHLPSEGGVQPTYQNPAMQMQAGGEYQAPN